MKPSLSPEIQTSPVPADAADDLRIGAGIDFAEPNSILTPLYLTTGQIAVLMLVTVLFTILKFIF
jgi:hypothetical protein